MSLPIISFCDVSGVMVKPWLEAGFECWIVDMQHPRGVTKEGLLRRVGADIHELYRGHWWLPESAHATFSFPDCTYLTISGNRWQAARGPGCVGRGLLFADACWRLHLAYGAPYLMENPAVGRLASSWRKPDFSFHPWEMAGWNDDIQEDNTAKNTGLWTGGGLHHAGEAAGPAAAPGGLPRSDAWRGSSRYSEPHTSRLRPRRVHGQFPARGGRRMKCRAQTYKYHVDPCHNEGAVDGYCYLHHPEVMLAKLRYQRRAGRKPGQWIKTPESLDAEIAAQEALLAGIAAAPKDLTPTENPS